jgi:predicted HTH domain antitoxin
MAAEHLTFELPNGLVEALGPSEKLAARARFLLIMDLLRRSEISEGKAAELLGVSRVEMMELAVEHKIPSGPETLEELIADVKTAERASHIRS